MSEKLEIDFTGLPVREMIIILRRIGMGLLEELLGEAGKPGEPLDEKPLPNLAAFFNKDDVKKLSRAHVWKIKRKRKTGRIPWNIREEPSRSLRKLINKSINGKIKIEEWQIGTLNRIALVVGGTAGGILPDELWPTIAEAAWCDPDFQLSVGEKINRWLRQTRLMVPFQPPNPRLSPNAFWVLIALAMEKPLTLRYWFSRTERAAVRAERRFQEEAHLRIAVNEWADFWDQWLIRLASQRWPAGFVQLDGRVCKALVALPLLDTTSLPKLCRVRKNLKRLIRLVIEKWFDKRDRIKRFPRPQKGRRKYALLNFSVPNWQEHMPEFFAAQTRR